MFIPVPVEEPEVMSPALAAHESHTLLVPSVVRHSPFAGVVPTCIERNGSPNVPSVGSGCGENHPPMVRRSPEKIAASVSIL